MQYAISVQRAAASPEHLSTLRRRLSFVRLLSPSREAHKTSPADRTGATPDRTPPRAAGFHSSSVWRSAWLLEVPVHPSTVPPDRGRRPRGLLPREKRIRYANRSRQRCDGPGRRLLLRQDGHSIAGHLDSESRCELTDGAAGPLLRAGGRGSPPPTGPAVVRLRRARAFRIVHAARRPTSRWVIPWRTADQRPASPRSQALEHHRDAHPEPLRPCRHRPKS